MIVITRCTPKKRKGYIQFAFYPLFFFPCFSLIQSATPHPLPPSASTTFHPPPPSASIRPRLKLKVENTMRWRTVFDKEGNAVKESNAKLVRWSDGTFSLHLGSEIFDVYQQPLQVRLGGYVEPLFDLL